MTDASQATGLFWASVFGAAIGVVAGTVIQYLLTMIMTRQARARQKNALRKELTYNASLVNELSIEVQKLRNAVNGGVLERYLGYFSFSKGIFAQSHGSANSGMLYELFSTDEIKNIQRVVFLLSATNENWVNAEITKRKNMIKNTPAAFDKHEAISFVDFLDNQIRDLGIMIDGLIKKLS